MSKMQITPKSIFHNYSDPNFLIKQNLQCCTSYSDYGTAAAEKITYFSSEAFLLMLFYAAVLKQI